MIYRLSDERQFYFRITEYFFIGGDSIEALNKYNSLIENISSCFPYTIYSGYEKKTDSTINGISTEYKITKVKDTKFKLNTGSKLTVWLCRDEEDDFFNVWFDCQTPESK